MLGSTTPQPDRKRVIIQHMRNCWSLRIAILRKIVCGAM